MLFFPLSFSDFELDPQRRCQNVLWSGILSLVLKSQSAGIRRGKKIFLLMLSKRISCGLNFFFFLPKKQFLSMPGLITRRRREPARTETRGTESQDWAGKTNTIINDRKCNIKWIKKPSTVSRVPDDETHNSDHICMINERGSLQSTSWSNNLLNIKAAQTSVGLKLFTSSHYTFNWTFLSISWPQWECFPATKDLNPRLKKNKQKTGTQQIH